jgi:hypothetical protein
MRSGGFTKLIITACCQEKSVFTIFQPFSNKADSMILRLEIFIRNLLRRYGAWWLDFC